MFVGFLSEVDTAGAGEGGLALREALGAAGSGYVLLGAILGQRRPGRSSKIFFGLEIV